MAACRADGTRGKCAGLECWCLRRLRIHSLMLSGAVCTPSATPKAGTLTSSSAIRMGELPRRGVRRCICPVGCRCHRRPFNLATRAAVEATRTIPIVMALAGAPLQQGLIDSLARPGGNARLIGQKPRRSAILSSSLRAADAIWSTGTARIHHAARRGGGLAARVAGAAAGTDAAHGVLTAFTQTIQNKARWRHSCGGYRMGWQRRPKCWSRYSLGCGRCDQYRRYAAELVALAPTSSWPMAARPWSRCYGDPHRTDRIRGSPTQWARLCCKPSAAGRQRHRFYWIRIRSEREVAGPAKQIAPRVTRVAVLRDTANRTGSPSLPQSRPSHPHSGWS